MEKYDYAARVSLLTVCPLSSLALQKSDNNAMWDKRQENSESVNAPTVARSKVKSDVSAAEATSRRDRSLAGSKGGSGRGSGRGGSGRSGSGRGSRPGSGRGKSSRKPGEMRKQMS